MLKHFKKIITAVLVISLIISYSVIFVSAEEAVTYNTIAHHHFANLDGAVPKNVNGSCSYIAASLLLSFYDSYWSDAFVASVFEGDKAIVDYYHDYPSNPPKLKLENEEWDTYQSTGSYADFIYDASTGDSNTNRFLHLKLLSMGLATLEFENGVNSESYGTSFEELATVLDDYFDVIFGPGDYYRESHTADTNLALNIYVKGESTPGENRQTIINKIKEEVSAGNPVLYRGTNVTESPNEETEPTTRNDGIVSHAMVAYNVRENGDVDLHIGWTSYNYEDNSPTISNTEYNTNIGVLWIDINENILPHNCSDNYLYRPSSSQEVKSSCACKVYINLHPAHHHTFENNFEICTVSTEFKECLVCERKVRVHKYDNMNKSSDGHWLECMCGRISNMESHNKIYTSSNGAGHSGCCDECGYAFTDEPHNLQNCLPLRPNAASHHRGTCACGYSSVESHTFEGIGLGRYRCTKCSYTKGLYGDDEEVHLGIEDDEESETE